MEPILSKSGLVPRGGPGLSCDTEGLTLGPVIIVEKAFNEGGERYYKLLPPELVMQALSLAYGPLSGEDIERYYRGIRRAAHRLTQGKRYWLALKLFYSHFRQSCLAEWRSLPLSRYCTNITRIGRTSRAFRPASRVLGNGRMVAANSKSLLPEI